MSKPTIVLVHGAFGDASSWRGVFDLLDGGEYTLLAAALPLRGVASRRRLSRSCNRPARRPRRPRRPFVRRLRDHGRGRLGEGCRARVRRRIRARRGRVDRRSAGPLPVARNGGLPPAAAAARRERRAVGRPRPLPGHLLRRRARRRRRVHGARAASARGHGVRGGGRGCRLAHEAVVGRVRDRETSRSPRSCTASRTTGPAPR